MAIPTRIIMLGTGDFALPSLEHLASTGHQIVALVTQPDRPQGRKQELIPSRIRCAAISRGIRVLQPEDVNAPEAIEMLRALVPDLLVTAAYGQILSADLLGVPRLGGINLHGSVLPAYRGAAPVARAIERGEIETGVTVILMTPRIDAGGMIKVSRTPIDANETAGELEDRLAALGAPLVAEAISELEAGTARVLPQDRSKVTKAPKLRKEDGLIDWRKSARDVHNLVRAMQPWPAASTYLRVHDDPDAPTVRLIVHKTELLDTPSRGTHGEVIEASASNNRLEVATGQGAVRLLIVQTPGKKPMPAGDFLRGHRVSPGDLLVMGPGVA
jgi:methionyl-tRNA formyltransferase